MSCRLPRRSSEILSSGRGATLEGSSCSRPLREDSDVDSFGEIDEALDRVAAQPVPETCPRAVSDEDLCNTDFPSECNESACGVALGFQHFDGRVDLTGDGQVFFELSLIFHRQVGLAYISDEQLPVE